MYRCNRYLSSLENDTCKFIVFDFDNHDEENIDSNDWKDEVDALRKFVKKLVLIF